MRIAVGLLIAGLMTAPTVAEELSPVTDRLLWCSSAMYWLAADAYDAAEDVEAEQYETWSDDLAGRAILLLEADGKDDAAILAIREQYDGTVLGEMGQPGARYDVTTCPDLATQ
jgi:hypothetical protein